MNLEQERLNQMVFAELNKLFTPLMQKPKPVKPVVDIQKKESAIQQITAKTTPHVSIPEKRVIIPVKEYTEDEKELAVKMITKYGNHARVKAFCFARYYFHAEIFLPQFSKERGIARSKGNRWYNVATLLK